MTYGDAEGNGWWREGGFRGWFGGLAIDFISGALVWPSMVTLPVEIWEPLAVTTQLGCGYLIAIVYFKEKHEVYKSAGLFIAVVSYIFLSRVRFDMGSTSPEHFATDLLRPAFLSVCAIWLSVIGSLCAVARPAIYYSVIAAVVDSIQFPSSRLLAECIKRLYYTCHLDLLHWFLHLFGMQTIVCDSVNDVQVFLLIFCWKLPSAVGYLYFQQRALQHGLMTVGAIFPLVGVVSTVSFGAAYFGDVVERFTVGMCVAATGLLLGITLLSVPNQWNSTKDTDHEHEIKNDSSVKDPKAKDSA
jgi:hypothetical protein